ncbi:MAG: hypothetical protein HQL70_10890 [Magnetococcales bacterium]|nr:hypothetical protein [Magnetococcales bacterium]
MWQEQEELTNNILNLIRDKRVYEAQLMLDETIRARPEFASELNLFTTLLQVGRDGGQTGTTKPEDSRHQLFQEAIEILNSSGDELKLQREHIERLELFLAEIEKIDTERRENRSLDGDSQHRQQLAELGIYLDKIRGLQARRQLDPAKRVTNRLSNWASKLNRTRQAKTVVHPVITKLEQLSSSYQQ